LEVLSDAGLNMTINCLLAEAISLLINGGLRKTTNHFLAEVESLLLSGGLRKTTNQSGGFWMTTNQITLACYGLKDRISKLEA
jgi:hypothetical protein